MASYILRQIDDAFWTKVKARAASEGRSLKGALLHVLALYADVGMTALEATRANASDSPGARSAPAPRARTDR